MNPKWLFYVFEVRWLCIDHLARKGPGRVAQGLSFGIGLIGIMWIGGSGESMGKRVALWAKDFIGRVNRESFFEG